MTIDLRDLLRKAKISHAEVVRTNPERLIDKLQELVDDELLQTYLNHVAEATLAEANQGD